MSIPILGQGPAPEASNISPQARLNIADIVGRNIADAKRLKLRHGRIILVTPADRTSAEFMVYLDSLLEAGCTLASINEHPAQDGNGQPCIQIHVVYRLPVEMAQ